jgi:hypothetical protein
MSIPSAENASRPVMYMTYVLIPETIFQRSTFEQQVAAPLLSARPKLQKWISDAETDDPESLGSAVSYHL